jgi:hypothetical protein
LRLHGVTSPSLPNYGRAGLDPFRGYNLVCARGPYISRARGVVRGGLRGILLAWVQCAIILIPQLFAAVLWPGTISRNPSWMLDISTFATLWEAYIRNKPHFHMWNHFFRCRLLPGSSAEAAVLGDVDIYVKFRHGVDPYFTSPCLDL